jgi:hypothetical protein
MKYSVNERSAVLLKQRSMHNQNGLLTKIDQLLAVCD